jgi:lathosterol oxidase
MHFHDSLQTFLLIVSPLPGIFAADYGRYLIAAALVSAALAIVSQRRRQHRAVRNRAPAADQRRREFIRSSVAALVFALVGLGVYHGSLRGVLHLYDDVAAYGHIYWLASLGLMIVAHDAYFYWTHRLLHRPALFSWTHRAHHQSVAPTQWAAYSFSIGEAIVQSAFVPIFLLFVPMHMAALFVWMAHQILRNVLGHCGVELELRSWLAGWWGRWITTTLHHDMHHSQGRHNYGLYFTWWDRMCGTEHPQYRERLQRLIDNIDAPTPLRFGKEA